VFELMIEDVSGEVSELVSMQPYGDLETAQRAASKFYEGKVGKWPSWIEWVQAGRTHWSADAGQWVFGITQRKIK
jgi:hypothetical protein